jgi:DNA-directed RNA polymerase, mitochondrial
VRAIIKFHDGLPLGTHDVRVLEFHCANCEGSADKETWKARVKWATNKENRKRILNIAKNPHDTFELWRNAKDPFQFVAACRELAAAWDNPDTITTSFITHLPIGFDATCNAVQHFALLARDRDAAARVNLTKFNRPRDVYTDIIISVEEALERDLTAPIRHKMVAKKDKRGKTIKDPKTGKNKKVKVKIDDAKSAKTWRECLSKLDKKQKRKLLKTPAFSFFYSATTSGMAEQITDEWRERFKNTKLARKADDIEYRSSKEIATLYVSKRIHASYLVTKVRMAAEKVLPGPTNIMRYIRKLANHCSADDRFLKWIGPSGFPVSNGYDKPFKTTAYLVEGGHSVRYTDADGCFPEINKSKAANSCAPNFVHSLDAAHLVKTINEASKNGVEMLSNHDCYYTLAPNARRLLNIIKLELFFLYQNDPLADLHIRNCRAKPPKRKGGKAKLKFPDRGDFNLIEILDAEWPFSG